MGWMKRARPKLTSINRKTFLLQLDFMLLAISQVLSSSAPKLLKIPLDLLLILAASPSSSSSLVKLTFGLGR